MRAKLLYFVIAAMAVLSLTACAGGSTATAFDSKDSIKLKYSHLLKLQKGDGFIVAEISNPWDSTKILHQYVLVPRSIDMPSSLPHGEVIRTPLQKVVFYTSVHTNFVNELGAYNCIAGVCDKEYMYLDKLQKDIKSGKIVDCGKAMTPNIEKIIDLQPDAIMLSPFENSGTYGKLGNIGIPIIECAEYMENGALARAEWMKFYGLLFDKQDVADSIFCSVEDDYNKLKAMTSKVNNKPTVVDGMKFGQSWYVAGGNSTVGMMIADAGGNYMFKNENVTGSVPYNPEVVLDKAHDADIWMIKYNQAEPMTYKQLATEWDSYTEFDAYKKKNVYACDLSQGHFYEETPFHPNLLLRDYIKIFHPEILKDYNPRYYKKMTK